MFMGPRPRKKVEMLGKLYSLRNSIDKNKWIIRGDFNTITSLNEKKGGRCHLNLEEKYLDTLNEELNLVDMKTTNKLFTWSKGRGDMAQISSHLDRFLVAKTLLTIGQELSKSYPFSGIKPLAHLSLLEKFC